LAAAGAALQFQTSGATRFEQTQEVLQAAIANATTVGCLDLPGAGPHFFGSFAFFEQVSAQSPFPPATLFLPRWSVVQQGGETVATVAYSIGPYTRLESLALALRQVERALRQQAERQWPDMALGEGQLTGDSEARAESFQAAVQEALQAIRHGQLHKVVLAHACDLQAVHPWQPVRSLQNLRQLYPDCYVFSVGNGCGQSFIGASPEGLIRLQQGELTADAIAGSAPRGRTTVEDRQFAQQLLSSTKDRWEHQVVVEAIAQRLEQLGISVCPPSEPALLLLPNIQHLHTELRGQVPPSIHLLEILAALHPTPAVAGEPLAAACACIQRNEPFDRCLYAAPVGWLDAAGNGEWAVAIRSALLDGCLARLYAGAGIVEGSDPQREWAEVQLKLQALLQALV
jgi:menaquinone-specific isochorismate synthase